MAEDVDKRKKRTKDTSSLLDGVIQAMLNQLHRPPCEECGFVGVTASDISNMTKFCKDNGYTVDKEDTEDFLDRLTRERKEKEQAERDSVQSRTS